MNPLLRNARKNETSHTLLVRRLEGVVRQDAAIDVMWAHGWSCIREDFRGDADAYVLDRHSETIKEYFDTGLTRSDWQALYNEQTITVPSRKISLDDVARYYTINVHLGKGKEGARRLHALRLMAAQAGYYWNREPSIGRWLAAVADEKIGPDWEAKPRTALDLQSRIRALAREQLKLWQELIEELDPHPDSAQSR
ncbi:MAG: hypothetical protein JSW37_13960 [Anaerolineales bacterium]|nr:MAG: hypothetical protein JSW37_13960 [Anaerolineales bacterium]